MKIYIYKMKINPMRCFLAIDVNNGIAKQIVELQNRMKKLDVDVKFVKKENLHFTMVFFGELNENEVNMTKAKIGDALVDIHEFRMKIGGIGYFGGKNYIKVIWLGVKEGEDQFLEMVRRIKNYVNFGEFNTHSPHITLCRVKSARNKDSLFRFINENKDVYIGEITVKNVKLKSSTLTPKGPIYKDISIFNLKHR